MWARRQAHETAIHRVDAQLAAGIPVTACAPAFAADGIDELLVLFVPRRGAKLRADPPATLAVGCTDVDASWLLRLDADGVTVSATTSSNDAGHRLHGAAGRPARSTWRCGTVPALTRWPSTATATCWAGSSRVCGSDRSRAVWGGSRGPVGGQAAGSRRRPTSQ